MNDCVFITIPGPLSPQRDIQSPLQVSEGRDGILGPDPESFGGVLCCPILSLTTTMVSELHTQRDVVFSCVKALRPPLCNLRSVKASQSCALSADVLGLTELETVSTSMHRKRHSLREDIHKHLSWKVTVSTFPECCCTFMMCHTCEVKRHTSVSRPPVSLVVATERSLTHGL